MLSNFLWKIKGKSAQGDGKKKLVYLGCATGCIFNIYLHKNIYINTKKKTYLHKKIYEAKVPQSICFWVQAFKDGFFSCWVSIHSFLHSFINCFIQVRIVVSIPGTLCARQDKKS